MSLPLFTRATIRGEPLNHVLKVLSVEEFLHSRLEPDECALWVDDSNSALRSRAVGDVRWGATIETTNLLRATSQGRTPCVVTSLRNPGVVSPGDVIRVDPRHNLVSVLHRRRSRTNSLLVTERCNSYCLMCSQPPIDRDNDGERVRELLRVASLIDRNERVLGITGGEPTLLGEKFIELLSGCRASLPDTEFHVLTNGRNFASDEFAEACASAAGDSATWGIPLYTDVPEIHDFVVQRQGAFVETMQGLINLARLEQRIEIRIVLQRATVERLVKFAEFIARNMSFVKHVAWMGLEPMGFARPNWRSIWIDPAEYVAGLECAVTTLDQADIATSIYNLPLCVLPEALWRFAAQSISDWKNEFTAECAACAVKDKCCGFFASAKQGYLPGKIMPIGADSGRLSGMEVSSL